MEALSTFNTIARPNAGLTIRLTRSPRLSFIDHLQVLEDHPFAMTVDEDESVDTLPVEL